MNEFLEFHNISGTVQKQIGQYVLLLWKKHMGFNPTEAINFLPSHLQRDLASAMHLKHLRAVPHFAAVEESFLRAIASRLVPRVAPAGTVITDDGDISRELHLIRQGVAKVISSDGKLFFDVLTAGDFFGEAAMVREQQGLRSARVLSVTDLELFVLSRNDFGEIVSLFPRYAALFEGIAKFRMSKYTHHLAINRFKRATRRANVVMLGFKRPESVADSKVSVSRSLSAQLGRTGSGLVGRFRKRISVVAEESSSISSPEPKADTSVNLNEEEKKLANKWFGGGRTTSVDGGNQSEERALSRKMSLLRFQNAAQLIIVRWREGRASRKYWYVIRPNSRVKQLWDLFVIIFVILIAVATPLDIGFNIVEEYSWLRNADLFGDIIFFVDVLLRFVTAVLDKRGELILQPRLIAREYITGTFFLDLIGVIPLDLIPGLPDRIGGYLAGSTEHTVRLASLLAVGRMLRFTRVTAKINEIGNSHKMRIIKLMLGYTVIAHWLCCLWFMVGRAQISGNVYTQRLPWVVVEGMCEGENGNLASPFTSPGSIWYLGGPKAVTPVCTDTEVVTIPYKYGTSLYFTVVTLGNHPSPLFSDIFLVADLRCCSNETLCWKRTHPFFLVKGLWDTETFFPKRMLTD